MSEELKAIKEMMDGISGGHWEWSNFTKPDGTKIESVEDICLILAESARKRTGIILSGVSSKDPDSVVVCYTGNGPKADSNARFLASAPDAIKWLLEELARIRAENEALTKAADNFRMHHIGCGWRESAEAAEAKLAAVEKERDEARRSSAFTSDWYKERFERMDHWMRNRVPDVVRDEYFSIQANASPTPWEKPLYVQTIHGFVTEISVLTAKVASMEKRRTLNERDLYPCCGRTEAEVHDGENCLVQTLREKVASMEKALREIASLSWKEIGPESGPIDLTPKERGMLSYIGRVAGIVNDALSRLTTAPEKDPK